MVSLSVIIPVYNEKATIREIIDRVQSTGLVNELIVVDNGSTDGTREILSQISSEKPIKLILQPQNMGKGAAVWTGVPEGSWTMQYAAPDFAFDDVFCGPSHMPQPTEQVSIGGEFDGTLSATGLHIICSVFITPFG